MTLNNWLCWNFDINWFYRGLIFIYGVAFLYIAFVTSFPLMFILGILAIVLASVEWDEIAKCELKEEK